MLAVLHSESLINNSFISSTNCGVIAYNEVIVLIFMPLPFFFSTFFSSKNRSLLADVLASVCKSQFNVVPCVAFDSISLEKL